MGTNFFTNEKENTLLEKIEGVFKYKKVHFFDALVGYFRASGYFHIRKFIQQTPQIRILVGINVDKLTYQANQQGLLFNPNAEQSQEEFFSDIKRNIQEAKYDKEVEDGMYLVYVSRVRALPNAFRRAMTLSMNPNRRFPGSSAVKPAITSSAE